MKTERDKLMVAIRKEFGDDCIIVYRPRGCSAPIASSALPPSMWKDRLMSLVERL